MKKPMVTFPSSQLKDQLASLGIDRGDTIFVAADLFELGHFDTNRKSTIDAWVNILIDTVGPTGTIVIPGHTRSFLRFRKKKDCIFTPQTPTTSGALSSGFQNHPNTLRSSHPTSSCFAIGRNAKKILCGHDENATSYLPFIRVAELNGKNLMLGTFGDKRLAPMTMHCAQEELGLTRKHWAAGLMQTYYLTENNQKKLFTRWDLGGCTGGGYNCLGEHIISNCVKFGTVGSGFSAAIDARISSEIFMHLFKTNPAQLKCGNIACPDCYGSPVTNHMYFWAKRLAKMSLDFVNNRNN